MLKDMFNGLGNHEILSHPNFLSNSLTRELNDALEHPIHSTDNGFLTRYDIPSTLAPFHTFENQRALPAGLKDAFTSLLDTHNAVMQRLIASTIENVTDYQYINFGGKIINPFAQIDTRGLPPSFIDELVHVDPATLVHFLRDNVFEVEVSLAMTSMLAEINPTFAQNFYNGLNQFRMATGKQIAILGVDQDKFEGICQSEYGLSEPPNNQIYTTCRNGFDAVVGPEGLKALINTYGEDLPYLFYVRPSLSADTLKNNGQRNPGILHDPELRRIIRAHAITPNVDNPDKPWHGRLNDTKAPQDPMGIALGVSPEDLADLTTFTEKLNSFLGVKGFSEEQIRAGVAIRIKPGIDAYGAYGQQVKKNTQQSLWNQVAKLISRSGFAVLQPEMTNPTQVTSTGLVTKYIHRIFVTAPEIAQGGNGFMGGYENHIPVDSNEVSAGIERIHGNKCAIWRPIQ